MKLDYIKEKEFLLLLENNIRGGSASVMGPRYVESNENKQILYIDANNLYGWAMCQPLPTAEFERITFPEDYTQEQIIEDLLQIPDDNESGFFIECDLEPSEDIKEKTENFPVCPYKTKADPELFSSYLNSILPKNYTPTTKLMCDVKNKHNYMIHYRMFKFYINSGMKITKIHNLYRFKQSPWLATYIDKKTENRSKSNTSFEKDIYKLMNNAFLAKQWKMLETV